LKRKLAAQQRLNQQRELELEQQLQQQQQAQQKLQQQRQAAQDEAQGMLAGMEQHLARLSGALRAKDEEVAALRLALAGACEERRQAQLQLADLRCRPPQPLLQAGSQQQQQQGLLPSVVVASTQHANRAPSLNSSALAGRLRPRR
jgi:hypothetical protein